MSKAVIKSSFNNAFPSANFNNLLEAEVEKAKQTYNKLEDDFNKGIYSENNSTCFRDYFSFQSKLLEKNKIIELLEEYDNFDIVFDETSGMWLVEIKTYIYNIEHPYTTALKKVSEYVNTKNELTEKYDFSNYSSNSTKLKFDLSKGVSSIKNFTKFVYTEEFVMQKLAQKFSSLFPQYNFITVLNAIYDNSCLTVKKYETEFNEGKYSWSNSKLIETNDDIPSRISTDKLKAILSKYDNFVIDGEDENLIVKKRVMEIESPEYMTIRKVIGLTSDFTQDMKKILKLEEYVSKF